jgi:hypothetical protein
MKARFMSAAVALLVSVSKALLFSFAGLANLGANTYNGGIGAKYFLSSALAIRGSLQFAMANQKILANPGVGQVGTDGSSSATRFGLSLGGEYHLVQARVSPYVGAALNFSSTSTESKTAGAVTPPAVFTQTTTKNALAGEQGYIAGTNIGVAGLVGAEFFVTKEVSLAGEYQLGFNMTSRPDQEVIAGSITTKTKTGSFTGLGFGTTALTLSVYF